MPGCGECITSAFRSLNPGEVHRPVVLVSIAQSLMGLKGVLKINDIQKVAFQTNRRQTVAFLATKFTRCV